MRYSLTNEIKQLLFADVFEEACNMMFGEELEEGLKNIRRVV
jgi:hypothetical protein